MKVVYLLRDPFTRRVRYIGRTGCLRERVERHVAEAKGAKRPTWKDKWILRLVALGAAPIAEVIQHVGAHDPNERERHWIRWYTARGTRLLNVMSRRKVKRARRSNAGDLPVRVRIVGHDAERFRMHGARFYINHNRDIALSLILRGLDAADAEGNGKPQTRRKAG